MKYKDLQNKVHEIEPEFSYLLPAGCVEITDEEAYSILNPVKPISERKDTLIAELETAYNQAISAPIAYLATTFQADKASQDLITDVLVAAGFTMPLGFMWRDINDQPILVEGNLLHGLAQAILMRAQPLFWDKSGKKDAINACLTDADLDLYLFKC